MRRKQSLSKDNAVKRLNRHFEKVQTKIKSPKDLQILVFSEKLGFEYRYPHSSKALSYHIASVGKVFTATQTAMLIEQGHLSFDTKITEVLAADILEDLFLHKGTDYASQVTVRQLMEHTSGIADYFEGPVRSGPAFLEKVIAEPDTHWTPQALLDFTREHQKPIGLPGERFSYSDSGYILLGLLIEAVTGKTFTQCLQDSFFTPLGMNDSYLIFYSEPKNQPTPPISQLWLNKTEVSTFKSLSCDWAGGGIVSTVDDLLLFHQALQQGKLISPELLKTMETCTHTFRSGIHYGLGMMEIRFEEFFFLLRGLPRLKGHIGISSTHMFFDPVTETYININLGSTGDMSTSFRSLIEIENTLRKISG